MFVICCFPLFFIVEKSSFSMIKSRFFHFQQRGRLIEIFVLQYPFGATYYPDPIIEKLDLKKKKKGGQTEIKISQIVGALMIPIVIDPEGNGHNQRSLFG